MRIKPSVLCVMYCVLCIVPAFAAYKPGEVIVKYRSASQLGAVTLQALSADKRYATLNIQQVEKVFPDAGISKKELSVPDLSTIYHLTLPKEINVEEALKKLRALPEVEYAEPNYIIRALVTPNDTYYSSQWGMPKISAEAAWDAITGSASITVAVVDTGVAYGHEDLTGKITLGYDFVNNDSDPDDDAGHGTHVAGIIGALTNNAKGVAGVSWLSPVMAVKVLDSLGNGDTLSVSRGINYAADHGAKVISMSFGDDTDNSTMKSAIISAYGKGCTLVAAAGNENTSSHVYPAAYNDYVIAVAATDQNDVRSDWGTSSTGAHLASNYGDWIDVCAPGSVIYSTWLSNSYKNKDGTSMATPYVAGLAALILSQDSTLSQADVRHHIETSCDSIDALNPGYAGLLGHGRINAAKAVGFPTVRITSPTAASYIAGTTAIKGTATGSSFSYYQIFIGTGNPATLYQSLYQSTSQVSDDTLYSFNTAQKPDGTYTIKLLCQGTTLSSETTVKTTIDNTLPSAAISSPTEGESVKDSVAITGRATDTNFSYYTLSYSKDGNPFVTIISSASAVASGALGSWNTAGLSGAYKLKLTAVDLAQNSTSETINVNVASQSSSTVSVSGAVKSSPNPFNPSQQTETYIYYTLSSNYPTTLYIFSLNGELVYSKNYASGEEGGKSGENLVPWDGKDASGQTVGYGVYFYKIAATIAGAKKVVGSGRLIVIR